MNFKNCFEYVCSVESILVIGLIVAVILNVILFSDKPTFLLGLNTMSIIIYFVITKREDKMILFYSALYFSFWGIILESFIIKQTNFAFAYKNVSEMGYLYVPSWLFTIYIIFIISALYTYNCFKLLLN